MLRAGDVVIVGVCVCAHSVVYMVAVCHEHVVAWGARCGEDESTCKIHKKL